MDLIKGFLIRLQSDWTAEGIINNYLHYSEEKRLISNEESRKILTEFLNQESDEIKRKKIDVSLLTIRSYKDADPAFQKMVLDEVAATNTYVVYNDDRSYVKYFLIKGDKIEAFLTTKRGKVFLII